ncbi:AFG1/ZapE family ATPase [Paenibacillus cymbidii]|uniref:AFG1/ZapE family ATPase n=1 Tax=Paenibacillus cymbidii TaxID=1639034 RepID=UPI001080EF44|nr:AFG1/ZapE family ATPase [Paenibacillus cymbidii]
MESLADVLKQMSGGSLLKQAEATGKRLLADPVLQDWRREHPELTDERLKPYMNKLYQYVKETKACAACPGLERCPNDFPGHYTVLSVEHDGGAPHLYDRQAACVLFAAKESQDAVRSRIRSFYVDERSLSQGYSAEEILGLDEERNKAVFGVMQYIDQTKERGLMPKGLYLVGPLGTGKTFLMCYLLYELAKTGRSGAIVYMPDFAEDLKAMFGEPQKLKETVDMLKETDLLIFDDIGAENLNPWLRDHVLGTILNYRMQRKPTFFTSNHELSALERHFSFTSREGEDEDRGKRIMDRIRPFVDVLHVRGANKRSG